MSRFSQDLASGLVLVGAVRLWVHEILSWLTVRDWVIWLIVVVIGIISFGTFLLVFTSLTYYLAV